MLTFSLISLFTCLSENVEKILHNLPNPDAAAAAGHRQEIIGESAVDVLNVRLEMKRSGREIIDETSYCTFECLSEDQEVWTSKSSVTCVESFRGLSMKPS
jgi:hypothetical protein